MEPIILPRISDQKPLVSVVSITYNHEPYIRDCLEGFLKQETNIPVEFIVHDDASTDHTADIMREYYEKRPDLFHMIIQRVNHNYRKEPLMAPLYEMAQGKYIALCEGDDYWTDPHKLQKQFAFLEANNYAAVVHKYEVVNKCRVKQDKKTFGFYDLNQTGAYTLKDFESDYGLPSQLATLMFKNFFLNTNEILLFKKINSKDIKINGDTKLFCFILLHGDIYRMKEIMSVYRFVCEPGNGSWTSRRSHILEPQKKWKSYRNLESMVLQTWGKNIDLRSRKLGLELEFLVVLKNSFSWEVLKSFLVYLLIQKDSMKELSRIIWDKILK